jgi:hypothetical protein
MGGVVAKQGALPADCVELIANDANALVVERIFGKAVYTNFATPARRVNYREADLTGSIAVSKTRLITAAFGRQQLHLPFTDSRIQQMTITVIRPNITDDGGKNNRQRPQHHEYQTLPILSIKADASFFNPLYTGEIELRWRTDRAEDIYRRIQDGLHVRS